MFRRLVIVSILVLCFGACLHEAAVPFAYAGLEDAKAAYDRGDYETAFNEFKALAEEGNIESQYNVGMMYYNGRGVFYKDYNEALKWFRKAAEKEFPRAQYSLGVMYMKGEGVPKDNAEAVKWYRKAADQELADAQYNLGMMYGLGQGVSKDLVQAHMWFDLAAEQGDSEAQRDKDKVAREMTKSQIAEAQRLAKQWKPKTKDYGLPDSFSR
jgi:hypothetical protein